jgi:hypothetical protein
VDIIAFYRVKLCAFLLVVKDLHRVVYGAKGVCLFHKVLSEFLSVAIVSECLFVLIVSD